MSVVLECRLLHMRALLARWNGRGDSSKGDPAGTATGRSQGITSTSSRIRSRRNAGRNISWVFTTSSSAMRDSARAWLNWVAVKKYVVRWTNWRTRITHTTLLQKNWCAPKQLVDPFEFCWFRRCSWGIELISKKHCPLCDASRIKRIRLITKIGGKALPHRGDTGKILGDILLLSITTKTDPALIDQGNLLKSDWDTCSRYDSQSSFGAGLQFKIQ